MGWVGNSASTEVQFRRQTSGSHAPVASQKGAIVPVGSVTGASLNPNNVAEVPRDTTSCPGLTTSRSGGWGLEVSIGALSWRSYIITVARTTEVNIENMEATYPMMPTS